MIARTIVRKRHEARSRALHCWCAIAPVLVAASAEGRAAPPTLNIPCTVPPLVDGQLSEEEWAAAKSLPLPGGARLLLGAASGELHLAVTLRPGTYRYVDLYVADGAGRLINLHASMQQGERLLAGDWSDSAPAFHWRPAGWTSSIARRSGADRNAPIEQQIAGLQGYEMRIPAQVLGRPPYRLRLEVRDFVGDGEDWVYPAASTRADAANWAQVQRWPKC